MITMRIDPAYSRASQKIYADFLAAKCSNELPQTAEFNTRCSCIGPPEAREFLLGYIDEHGNLLASRRLQETFTPECAESFVVETPENSVALYYYDKQTLEERIAMARFHNELFWYSRD